MKITSRQAEARRANGKLSTGPKTAEGKAASSRNSLKFGFFALNPLLPGESETEFAAFRAGWVESLRPDGFAERALVDRIADSAWRLRRFPAVEAALYSAEFLDEQAALVRRQAKALLQHRLDAAPEEAEDPVFYRQLKAREREIREELNSPQYALGRAFRRDARNCGGFTRLSRCETLLERGLYRALNELRRIQAERTAHGTKGQNEPTDGAQSNPHGCQTPPGPEEPLVGRESDAHAGPARDAEIGGHDPELASVENGRNDHVAFAQAVEVHLPEVHPPPAVDDSARPTADQCRHRSFCIFSGRPRSGRPARVAGGIAVAHCTTNV
jgi:hypothetical protein